MDYEVKLEIFEGPLDLLLHLIRKNELDIFDIPIATITDQYLAYLDLMKALNISLAGDFLVMASTLVHIKSRMLLPGAQEEDAEDPRMEIARPLIEYLKLKEAAEDLTAREVLERDVFARRLAPELKSQLQSGEPMLEVSLFQLIDAFKRIVEEKLPGTTISFQREEWSLKDKTTQIVDRLKTQGAFFFIELFDQDRTISEFVVTFLALLELVQMGLVRIVQAHLEADILLEPHFKEDEENNHVEIAQADR
ncbi:MAG: segregation and condensation protein A [Deltaproteobacteria bacterium]